MRFSTSSLYHVINGSIVAPPDSEGKGSSDWMSASCAIERGRTGRVAAFTRLECDDNGRIVPRVADIPVARRNEGASWTERLSVPLTFDSPNSTAGCAVTYDFVRSAGLQGSVHFRQTIGDMQAERLDHRSVQAHFPNMTTQDATHLSRLMQVSCTSEGNLSELFFRLLIVGSDYHAGARGAVRQIGGNAPTMMALLHRMWPTGPQGAGYAGLTYDPLMQSFQREQQNYYLVGARPGMRLSASVLRALWAITEGHMGFGGNQRQCDNAYARHQMFTSNIFIWIGGLKHRTYVAADVYANAAATAPTDDDTAQAIRWLLHVTGDKDGLSQAVCMLAERLPLHELRRACAGIDLNERCHVGFSDMLINRLTLMIEMMIGAVAGVPTGAFPAAYQGVFGANPPNNIDWIALGGNWQNLLPDPVRQHADGEAIASLLRGLYHHVAGGHNLTLALAELTRMEAAVLIAWLMPGHAVPLRVRGPGGQSPQDWPNAALPDGVNTEGYLTRVASASNHALPALGIISDVSVAASNGLHSWLNMIGNDDHGIANPSNYVVPQLPTSNELYCSIAIIAAYMRGLADENLRIASNCEGLRTLIEGGEPIPAGGAAAWGVPELDHAHQVFGSRRISSAQEVASYVRGGRVALWPALNAYVGFNERLRYPVPDGGLWDVAVAFTPLQQEALTGLSSSVGGMFKSLAVLPYVSRVAHGYLNAPIDESDISRQNRMHLAASVASLSGQGVNFQYNVRSTNPFDNTYFEYNIPLGSVRRVRSEHTHGCGEVVTTMAWLCVLPEQQLGVVDFNDIMCSDLVNRGPMQFLSHSPHWVTNANTVCPLMANAGMHAPGLMSHTCPQMAARWRTRANVLPPIDPAAFNGNANLALCSAFNRAFGASRLLLSPGGFGVPAPWSHSSRFIELPDNRDVFIAETGTNRFLESMRVRLGLPTREEENQRRLAAEQAEQAARRAEAENAVAAQQTALLTALQVQVQELQAQIAAQHAGNAVQGANIDRPDMPAVRGAGAAPPPGNGPADGQPNGDAPAAE